MSTSPWIKTRAAAISVVLGLGLLVLWSRAPGYLPVARSEIIRVELVPVPEGPPSRPFVIAPDEGWELSLDLIRNRIPSPLPRPLAQGWKCRFGGNVEIELRDGRTIRYGPCRRPPEIERLRADMLRVYREHRLNT